MVSAFLAIFDLESKIWRTVRDLVTNPGRVALDYIGGRRFSYINPLKYFLTVLAIYLGVLALTFGLDYLADQMVQVEGEDPAQAIEVGDALKSVIRNHMNLMIVLTVPVFAFLLRWQFWRSGRNYAESLSFVSFIAGQAYLYRIAIVLVEYALGSFSSGLGPAASFLVLVQARDTCRFIPVGHAFRTGQRLDWGHPCDIRLARPLRLNKRSGLYAGPISG